MKLFSFSISAKGYKVSFFGNNGWWDWIRNFSWECVLEMLTRLLAVRGSLMRSVGLTLGKASDEGFQLSCKSAHGIRNYIL